MMIRISLDEKSDFLQVFADIDQLFFELSLDSDERKMYFNTFKISIFPFEFPIN